MSQLTKSMTHYIAYAEGMIALEAKARGLAENLFIGTKALAFEIEDSDKKLDVEFNSSMKELESSCYNKLVAFSGDKDATMAKYITGFKNRKSEIKKGLEAGVDPRKFDSFTAFRKATDKVTGSNADGRSNKGTDNTSNKSDVSTSVSTLQSVTSAMPKAVQDKLTLMTKHLVKLDEGDALKILGNCDGAIHHMLNKAGGRYANVNKQTA